MIGTNHLYFGYTGKEIVPAVLYILATAAGAQLLQFLEHTAILGHKTLAELYLIHQAEAGLALVVKV